MLKIHTFAVTINFNIMIPMKKVLFITLLLICSLLANAQIKVTGTVYSEADRETLIGATVIIEGAGNGTITDVDGKFAITCNALPANVKVSYMGMDPKVVMVMVVPRNAT